MIDPDQWSRMGHDKAKLVSLNQPIGMVIFDYNPNRINFTRNAITKTRGTSSGTSGSQLVKSELASIRVSEVILEGSDTKNRCDMLLSWAAQPEGIAQDLAQMLDLRVELPILTFQWGPPMVGFVYQVVLKTCQIDYERFGDNGEPSRAKINLTMEQQPSLLGSLPTNPTSGGLAGRGAHEMHQGENLVHVAKRKLGHPRYWRALAQANGLDDPLRIKPGTSIYVPSPRELETGD
ncbi:CIS tube protein [Streptomyces sp. NPDC055085]